MTTLRVFRWSEGGDERFDAFEVTAGPDTTVLDALVEAQRAHDSTLAFRYACRVGMCGSCAMVVNGRERWACRTLLSTLRGHTATIRPLYHFPLIRDLVVDMTPFVEKMKAVQAAFVPMTTPPELARIGATFGERGEIDPALECIGCGACLSACTMVAHDPRFPGPAALNRAFTLIADSRDAGKGARWAALLPEDALWRCHGQANCTDVCPMELSPTYSILRLRRRAVASVFRARA